ncbi:MAG: phosphomannomutase/phosphoglucomutase [Actinomycetota bacterium]|nr:phosphomannomutase/phosphoglucomutase [Actinomycetota bacterium]
MQTVLPDNIFREYDIRGVWGKDLTEDVVFSIGRAFAYYLREHLGKNENEKIRVTIGRDVRLSSPVMRDLLAGAFTKSGIDVIDIGMCPTPLQYFSLFKLPVDGGVMITASHNPAEFNGMKLSLRTETLYGDKIQEVKKLIEQSKFIDGAAAGSVSTYEIIPDYIKYMREQFGPLDGLNVVLDGGNGVAGLCAPEIVEGLGANVTNLFMEPDGRFPNHHPDPVVVKNITALIDTVRKKKAHLGVGYDGDADRVGIVDEDGEMIWGDKMMIIFARDLLKSHPGAMVIGEVKCSQTLYDDIAAHGGKPLMWKTGHSLIKSKMRETGALISGEMSGHIFFADRYFGYDDAIYASLRLMEIVKKNGPPYSVKKLLAGVPDMVATPEIRVDCPDEKKFGVVEKVKAELAKEHPIIGIDGVRVQYPEGWGLVRASNTQPALVLRFEAKDEKSLEKIRADVEGKLKRLM